MTVHMTYGKVVLLDAPLHFFCSWKAWACLEGLGLSAGQDTPSAGCGA